MPKQYPPNRKREALELLAIYDKSPPSSTLYSRRDESRVLLDEGILFQRENSELACLASLDAELFSVLSVPRW